MAKTLVSRENDIPWRNRPFLRVREAAAITGLSTAAIYAAHHAGRIQLKKLEGRTLVPTDSLVTLLDSATAWSPGERGKAAVAARSSRARQAWGN